MSDTVIGTAILRDCFCLAQQHDELSDTFKEAMKTHQDFSYLAGLYRGDGGKAIQLLGELKTRWPDRKIDEHLEAKLTFVLGWLTQLAAQRRVNPETSLEKPETLAERSLRQDTFFVRERMMLRAKAPRPKGKGSAEEITALFHVLLMRALIALHTIRPDKPGRGRYTSVHAWLEGLFELHQSFGPEAERYTSALTRPDADEAQTYVGNGHFYRADEPVLVLVRLIQEGGQASPGQIAAALDQEAESQYAAAVQLSLRYLLSAHRFFVGKSDLIELLVELDLAPAGAEHAR